MKKRCMAAALSLCLLLSFATSAFAAGIMPLWNTTDKCDPNLVVSSTTAYCSLTVIANSGDAIDATLTLQQENARGSYINVKRWAGLSGTGSLSFSDDHPITAGGTYRLKAEVKVVGSFGDTKVFRRRLAAEEVSYEEKIVEVNGYSFDIIEKVNNDDCTVVRTYENPNFSSKEANVNDVDKAKALLIALGMDEENLDLWSDQSILDVANGESITVNDAYYKVNNYDNSSTKVPEDVAITESTLLNEKQLKDFITKSTANGIEPYGSDIYEDSYIRVYHVASYQGNAQYFFGTDSLWLTMPKDRYSDSLGSCAQRTTFTPKTNSGSHSYDMTTVFDGEVETRKVSSTNFITSGFANSSGWAGAAGVFKLPTDAKDTEGNSIKYTNFRAHYEYKGKMQEEDTPNQNFNSNGTYLHAVKDITVSPNITISNYWSGCIGLSISSVNDVKPYSVLLDEHYTGK